MKAKQKSVRYLYRVIMAVWLLSGVVQVAYSEEPEGTQGVDRKDIGWDSASGTDGEKSDFYPPVTAYIESSILYISNERPAGAIDVAIPLDGLPAGSYSLQLANEWGGYVTGSFRI